MGSLSLQDRTSFLIYHQGAYSTVIYYLLHENQPPVAPIIGYLTNNQGLLQSGHNLIQAGDWEGVVAQAAVYTGLQSQSPFISDSWRHSDCIQLKINCHPLIPPFDGYD